MADDEQEIDGSMLGIPTYPFVASAALADALEMAAAIAEASAEFMRNYAERTKADHNAKVDAFDGIAEAAAEIEQIIKGGDVDG